jgi:hypothetical protein
MISRRQRQYWIDFLAGQIVVLENLYSAATGEPHVASPELVSFLETSDILFRDRVERAVADFAARNAWPSWLKADQIVSLVHRATMAHGLLAMIQNGQLLHASALETPESKDRPNFLRWLFIDLWGFGGAHYLEALTNSYFAKNARLEKGPH